MFAGKDMSLDRRGVWKLLSRVGSSPSRKHVTKQEKFVRDKDPDLFYPLLSNKEKDVYNIGPRGLYYKTFNGRNLRIFVIS